MNRAAVILIIGAAVAAAGWLSKSDYLVSVATSMAFFALWAQSWNLLCACLLYTSDAADE